MKGIILAGGLGTRLSPVTKVVSKQLLPIYDKPLIYYSLSTLMLSGIRDILVISTPIHINLFKNFLGDGTQFGVNFQFATQSSPSGIAESLIISEKYIFGQKSCLILGDNVFHGYGLGRRLELFNNVVGAQAFGYQVKNSQNYGIATLDEKNKVVKLEEKPEMSISNIAIPGLYFFDESASARSKLLEPSIRGELEIVDLLQSYLTSDALNLEMLPRGTAWFDAGTFEDLHEAGSYVRLMQERTGEQVGNPMQIAKLKGWI